MNDHLLEEELFIRFTVRVFHERLSFLCVCPSFPFGFEGGMWDLLVLIPDHCLSIYFPFAGTKGILLLKNGK